MLKVKVKFIESFKDGNIFGEKIFLANETAVLTQNELLRTVSSGAMLEILENVIPNPLKKPEMAEETKEKVEAKEAAQEAAMEKAWGKKKK